MTKIAALVVNYNNPVDTAETIKSLLKQVVSPNKYQLVVYLVNNGCTDSSSLLSKQFPEIEVISSPINLGFAGGNNLGIKKALSQKCTHILLINNDATVITKDFFEKFLLSKADITAPLIEYQHNGKIVRDYGGKVDYLFGRNTHVLYPAKVDYYSGACLFINSKVFAKAGLLDDSFFLYYEDVDFCLRSKKAGFNLDLVPEARVLHKLSASTNKLGAKKIKILAESHLLFCKRHLPLFSYPFYKLFSLYLRAKILFL